MKTLNTILLGALLFGSTTLAASEKANSSAIEKEARNEKELATIPAAKLNGKVVDSNTGEALVGVTVRIDGTQRVAFTDFDGNFEFTNINPDGLTLSANYISYQTVQMSVNLKEGENVRLTLKAID